MSRISRNELLYEGCYAHVISRSIRKMRVFAEDEDFDQFKKLLLIAKKAGGFAIYHYCLMQTHFHLAVRMGRPDMFSIAMRDLKRSYVYWYHAKNKISGPLWRGRYRSLLTEDENYLFTCGKYIESNPVKAGLVASSELWGHGSARYYINGIEDDLLDRYEKDVKQKEDLSLTEEECEKGTVIGSSFFRFQFYDSRRRVQRVP